jgi:hypothetical protein
MPVEYRHLPGRKGNVGLHRSTLVKPMDGLFNVSKVPIGKGGLMRFQNDLPVDVKNSSNRTDAARSSTMMILMNVIKTPSIGFKVLS